MENLKEKHSEIVSVFEDEIENFEYFLHKVKAFFESRRFRKDVHSIRYRIKDIDHLLEKIERKNQEDETAIESRKKGPITPSNIFTRITDLAGIRVLHLHSSQFENIHNALIEKVNEGEFVLVEPPKAYTWDPESITYFEGLGIQPEVKQSFYTSIHYVLKPNTSSKAICELQVRTLLEEVWGEIDHTMNYPHEHPEPQCKEQIRVLARLIGAGSHLADSIMRRYK